MENRYQELITCKKCSCKVYRDAEIRLIDNKQDLETPLKIVLVKKFQCKKCKDSEYTVEFVKKSSK